MDRLIADGEIYRLFTCNLTFSTMAELIMGLLVLVPLLRRYEREMGTARFVTYLLLANILSTFLELCLATFYPLTDVRFSGPYPSLGAVLYLYHVYAPRLHPKFYGMLGLDFSEKSLTYFFALQVLLSGGWGTLQPALCGAVAGYLVRSPVLPLSKMELPDGFFGWLDRDVPQTVSARRPMPAGRGGGAAQQRQRLAPGDMMGGGGFGGGFGGGGGGGFGGGGGGGGGGGAAAAMAAAQQPPPPPPPSDEAIGQLTAMGFERQAVVRALGQTDNNVEAAANRLLAGS